MFQTVRHWWGSGRGKVTARLFLFELFVVIAGKMLARKKSAAAPPGELTDTSARHETAAVS
jgi:hypothetical protein